MKPLPEALALYWSLAIARKLYATALSERRFAAASDYLKAIEATERRARLLLSK